MLTGRRRINVTIPLDLTAAPVQHLIRRRWAISMHPSTGDLRGKQEAKQGRDRGLAQ